MLRRAGHGITLPEVLMVILILGLLAATIIPRFVYSSEAKSEECIANVTLMNARLDQCFSKGAGRSPENASDFERLVATDRDVFPCGMPRCPYARPYQYDPASGHIVAHQH
jgi:prepilin-type N-terminal cleavage/methylation domain-containing protein